MVTRSQPLPPMTATPAGSSNPMGPAGGRGVWGTTTFMNVVTRLNTANIRQSKKKHLYTFNFLTSFDCHACIY
jgi:hypothetical protein